MVDFASASTSTFSHASLDSMVSTPVSWWPLMKASPTVYPHKLRSACAAHNRSACGSMGSMGHCDLRCEMTKRLLQARWNAGWLGSDQKDMVCRMPTIPTSSLLNELWLTMVPGVCHVPIRRVAESGPLMIHAAALVSSLKEPSLTV